ncbi:MAG: type II toxin-antitoxin system VapC family toxin [Bacteroidota bacterium]|nr:type II toxin-antitoxin system VapC family toxin [Bacteroidota bacterium]
MEKELILCDTNIFISWFRGDLETRTRLQLIGLEYILIPSVTVMELVQGTRNKKELIQLKKKLKAYHIIHFNEITSRLAIELIERHRLSHGLLIPDAIIAATAITFNLKLFTYNLKDFKFIPGIQIYEY